MTFVIDGPPRTKKTHNRIIQAGGRPRVLPSKAHEQWAKRAIVQLRQQWAWSARGGYGFQPGPLREAVSVRATVYREKRIGDLCGFLQAIGDALEHSGIIANDRQIASWDGSRLEHDKARPRVELTVERMVEQRTQLNL